MSITIAYYTCMYRDEFRNNEREFYWSAPRIVLALLLVILTAYGFGFLATGGDLAIYRFWAPKQEAARREVYINTASFVQGKISYLTELRLSYEQSEGAQKNALRTAILREAAQVDNSLLPADLSGFVTGLKGGF